MASHTVSRHRYVITALLVPVLIATLLQGVAAGQPGPADCVPPLPVASVTTGMKATGWTVAKGTRSQAFGVEVLGVMKDAILPGRDLIIAEISGPVVDVGGGVWAGMSGSPVYVTHGGTQRLLGAVAWGFTMGPSPIVGLTTGPDIVELTTGNASVKAMAAEPSAVEIDDATRVAIASRTGVSAAQVGGEMRRMPVGLSVSGLQKNRMDRLREKVRGSAMAFVPYAGSSVSASATASPASLRPGDNFAGALSYGDITAAGIGTATYVCNGRAVAFGHPFTFQGPVAMGANTADAIAIVKDPVFGPFKLANIGRRVGTIDNDRFAGIEGRLGAAVKTVPVTSTVVATQTGRQRAGRTDVVFADWLPDLALMHAFSNIDSVFDQFGEGNALMTTTVTGRRADGSPWKVTRDNRFASEWDIAFDAVFESYFDLLSLVNNPHEEVTLTSVDFRIRVDGEKPLRHTIKDVLVSTDGRTYGKVDEFGGLEVQGGKLVYLRVTLGTFRGEDTTVDFAIGIPHDAAGFGMIEVRGGPVFRDPWECLFDPQACFDGDAEGFAGVLKEMNTRPRSDDLVARLTMFPDPFGGEPPFEPELPENPIDEVGPFNGGDEMAPRVVSTSRKRLDRVVGGERGFAVVVEPGTPPDTSVACPPWLVGPSPFADVWGTAHEETISCMYGFGIAQGVSDRLYAPAGTVTRGQMASFVSRALDAVGVDLPPGEHGFTDVAGHPHAPAIGKLAAAGIIAGTTATTFSPNEAVTRGQMASTLVRAYERAARRSAPATPGWFMDVGGTTHEAAINAAAEARLVTGVEPGVFGPSQPVRRGQMATALARLLNALMLDGGGGDPIDDDGLFEE